MFSSSYQSGFVSIFFSVGSNPLALWDKQVKNGHIRRVIDDEVKSLVLDIGGTNVATTYITCPIKPRASLGIKLPYLVMVIKNMKKYFTFEIQILDDKDMRRRFRVSNFQSTTKVRPFCTTMPIGLSSGWNQVQFNLADFTKRAYGSMYMETVRVQIHANVRIRRIYFTDQLHSDEELPNEFKLFAPGPRDQKAKVPEKPKEEAPPEQLVPPIKTDKPEEEVPPPPSPAEESPIAKEETQLEGEAPPEQPAEGESAEIPPEAPGAPEEGAEPKEEPAEGAEPVEGLPPEGEQVQEAPEGAVEEAGGEEPPAEGEVTTAPEGESPAEGEIPTTEAVAEEPAAEAVEAEGEQPSAEAEQSAAPPEAEESPQAPEVEAAETVVETEATTEVTETTDTEASPSEPATTDNEEN